MADLGARIGRYVGQGGSAADVAASELATDIAADARAEEALADARRQMIDAAEAAATTAGDGASEAFYAMQLAQGLLARFDAVDEVESARARLFARYWREGSEAFMQADASVTAAASVLQSARDALAAAEATFATAARAVADEPPICQKAKILQN
jgi:hypothetical protein